MSAGSAPDRGGFTIQNEFAQVHVEMFEGRNGPRAKVTDLRSGVYVLLDALELESLAWLRHVELDPLLDPNRGRWRGADPESA